MVLRLNEQQKYWVFLTTTILTGLYFYESTRWEWVAMTVEYKADFAPILSVKNFMTIILIYLFYKIFITGRN